MMLKNAWGSAQLQYSMAHFFFFKSGGFADIEMANSQQLMEQEVQVPNL